MDMADKHDIKKILEEKAPLIDKAIEKYLPRKYDKEKLVFTFGRPRYEYSAEVATKTLADPIWDLLDRGGKRWRPTLFLLVIEALGGDQNKLFDFAIIPEVVHNGTLIIDDIEDSSEERRGKPCTYKVFGLDVAVNAGSAAYYLPLLSLIKRKNEFKAETIARVYEIYVQEMINLSLGQAMDIAWHKGLCNANNVTEKEYLQMTAYKTGTLARMSAKIAAMLCDASDEQVEAIGKLVETIGIAFQIQDDILNLVGGEFFFRKGGAGEDITEGKRTLMVIHSIKNASSGDAKRLIEILEMHTLDQKLRNEAIEIMKKYDSIDYAKEFARKILKEAWKEVDTTFPQSEAKEKIKAFADYLVERDV